MSGRLLSRLCGAVMILAGSSILLGGVLSVLGAAPLIGVGFGIVAAADGDGPQV